MIKNYWIYLAILCVAIGCKKVDVDFTFSPAEPKAGEAVKFTNNSSAGEKWNWDFGDNVASVLKNPQHIFTRPGTYLVTLMVDSVKRNTCSHSIIVYDTIPTFVTSTDSICHYTDVTLSAHIYNPHGLALSYEWVLPQNAVLTYGTLKSGSIAVYFKEPNTQETVALTIRQGDNTYPISRELTIHETKAPAVIMSTTNHLIWRQGFIIDRWEEPVYSQLEEDAILLNSTTDTMVIFNNTTFYANQMADIFPGQTIQRIQLDAMAQKWYITTAEGLFVANFDGQNIVAIDADATGGIYVDIYRNILYWASTQGLKSMPLIKSKNNQFATKPLLHNTISDIDRVVVNYNLR